MYYPKEPKPISAEEMDFLDNVAEQLGIYLERNIFEERVQSEIYTRQVEKLHNAIFRSLSKGFYSPLEKISSINERIKESAQNQEQKALAKEMELAGKNLKIIVDNILTISQLESGFIQFEKQKHSIKDLISQSIKEIKAVIDDHPIHIHLPEQDLFFDFDFELLKSALKNLLINAMEYSPVNSPITIEFEVSETEFKISVIDEGSGISQETIPYIFEKFYRTPGAKTEGIGLGLTIVKAVVDLHQGKMEVQSREGQGTKFSLILPK
jgi:two-component system, OmpR family, sensor histidine kinase KdpD